MKKNAFTIIFSTLIFPFYFCHCQENNVTQQENTGAEKQAEQTVSTAGGMSCLEGDKVSNCEGFQTTYGEIVQDGLDKIIEYANNKNVEKNIFYDLGCGKGGAVIYFANQGFQQSIGIEVVTNRYEEAVQEFSKLDDKTKARVKLLNDTILSNKYNYGNANIIYASNLCFSEDLQGELYDKLEKEITNSCLVFVSKAFPKKDEYKLQQVDQIMVSMTWNAGHTMHVYKKS